MSKFLRFGNAVVRKDLITGVHMFSPDRHSFDYRVTLTYEKDSHTCIRYSSELDALKKLKEVQSCLESNTPEYETVKVPGPHCGACMHSDVGFPGLQCSMKEKSVRPEDGGDCTSFTPRVHQVRKIVKEEANERYYEKSTSQT